MNPGFVAALPIARRRLNIPSISLARILTVSALLAYPILLFWVYRDVISPIYSYMAYVYYAPEDYTALIVGYVLAVLPAFFMPLALRPVGSVAIWILYLLVYVPSQIVPSVVVHIDLESMLALQLALFAGLVIIQVANYLPTMVVPTFMPAALFLLGIIGWYVATVIILVYYYGVPTSLPSFSTVYDVRLDLRDVTSSLPIFVGYIWAWFGQVLNPLLVGYGAKARRPVLTALGFAGQIYIYGLSGAKYSLFSVLLALALLLLLKCWSNTGGAIMAIGASLLVLVSVAIDRILHTTWLVALFVQRLIITPGLLTAYYHEYFSRNPRGHFSGSILSPVFDFPYPMDIPFIIGTTYFKSSETRANANLWADGTANYGIGGILFVSLLTAIVIWMFNSLANGRSYLLVGIMTGFVAFTLTSAAFFTSLLTHGIVLTLIAVALFPSETRVTRTSSCEEKEDRSSQLRSSNNRHQDLL